ncbi:MAG: S41 family peptidase [Bacteroidota bacterium]
MIFFLENVLDIEFINGISKDEYIDSIAKMSSYSHKGALMLDVIMSLMWNTNDSLVIDCKNGERHIYYHQKWKNNTLSFLKNDSILYINLNRVYNSTVRQVKKILQKNTIKYVFVDFRNGPERWQSWRIINFFGRKARFSFYQEGFFYCLNNYSYQKEGYQESGDGLKFYTGNIYALIDEISQSSDETGCMILKTNPNSIFIGRNTVGANGNVGTIQLPFELLTEFSYLKYSYPNGENYQNKGIKPDIKINICGIKTIEQIEAIIQKCNLYKYGKK